MTDLASIINGLAHNGQVSIAGGQTLVTDLGNAQNACSHPSQRIAALQRFIADAAALTPSNAQFLKFGAQPLMATSIPASSCR